MTEEKNENAPRSSYRGILKATSLFGGVQIYQIFIEVVKSKFIAILLGPEGIGIHGLYTSGIQMIQHLSSFGLSQSAVRNVAEAYGSGDNNRISRTVIALRRLVWLTGILGMIVVILLSPVLSKSSFGDNLHIWGFAALSITLLLTQINAGQKVILQGTRKYKHLAKCTAYGMTIGLFVSVPLYYLMGVEAIVPNIIIGSITSLLLSWYYSRKIQVSSIKQTQKETFYLGRSMLTMGIVMSLTQFITIASSYTLRSCIRMWGSVEEVGFYTAGFLLMGQYTGLVFQSMATDFYPRLAAVNQDNQKCRVVMNQQGEVGFLLLGPLMVLFVVFVPVVVEILYSDAFLAVNDYIIWCALGVIFQMASWSVSYILVAKAESKTFAINEFVVGIYGLGLNLIGYNLGGLTGLGISFVIKYILYFIQVYTIARLKYNFSFTNSYIRLFLSQILIVLSAVIMVLFIPSFWRFLFGGLLAVFAALFSFKELDSRMDIMSILRKR